MAELRIALQHVYWQQELGVIAGVYVITDKRSGKHYVGSASGSTGILQRWSDYATTGHGGNAELVELLREFPGRENDLRLTLLEAMPLSTPQAQVIARKCSGKSHWAAASSALMVIKWRKGYGVTTLPCIVCEASYWRSLS